MESIPEGINFPVSKIVNETKELTVGLSKALEMEFSKTSIIAFEGTVDILGIILSEP